MLPYLFTFLYILQLARATSTNTTTTDCPSCEAISCNYRSVWSLLASCGATLLICVWHAIHPSIPLPHFKWFHIALYRLFMVLIAFCTPELMIASACDEWNRAKEMTKQARGRGHEWTMTHSHFFLIGGFAVRDNTGIREIKFDDFLQLVEAGNIVNPMITKDEIMDKSSSDDLAKAILVVQLTWFVTQVVARLVNHFAVTLIELDTVCMALLTLPLIFFWWEKPHRPGHPYVFYTRTFVSNANQETTQGDDDTEKLLNKNKSTIVTTHRKPVELGLSNEGFKFTLSLLLTWAIFGALHAIAWNYEFPTEVEKTIWRVSSLTLAGSPVIFGVSAAVKASKVIPEIYTNSVATFLLITGITSRLLLVGLMLASLRSMPSSARQTIIWTNYIPHL